MHAIDIVQTNGKFLHLQVMHTVNYNVHFHVHVTDACDVFKIVVLDMLYSLFLFMFTDLM